MAQSHVRDDQSNPDCNTPPHLSSCTTLGELDSLLVEDLQGDDWSVGEYLRETGGEPEKLSGSALAAAVICGKKY